MSRFITNLLLHLAILGSLYGQSPTTDKPNIVIIITDDQGYGDLSCHGNPVLKTPQLDKLYGESVRLKDYHVAPTCSPTRCALLTGHWTNRTGVWHTIMGRSMLRENEITLGQIFKDAGYATGMFGKWHLGDNYPYRPEDRGFTEVMRHGGGGVGQTPDYWDNAYFDGSYWHNGTPEAVKGFCTDVFFDYAKKFIKAQKAAGKPFLAYISTNAPHGPMHAPEEFAKPYLKIKGNKGKANIHLAHFYGMIANIDHNVGTLRQFLDTEGLTDNTIFIFTTDNGSAAGTRIHNVGMRGGKGSEYDGGHRVPFFIHWPKGGFTKAYDVEEITAHVDIVPTLINLCQIPAPQGVKFDGRSILPLLPGGQKKGWPDRILITDSQRVKDPIKWRKSAVMTSQWRLINGKQLYNIKSDPGQKQDVAQAHPKVVKRLTDFYEQWWAELSPTFKNETPIYLGHPKENPARLTSHDWISSTGTPPWNQSHIRRAVTNAKDIGFWNVKVVKDGDYEFRLRRWPEESDLAIDTAIPPGASVPGVKSYRAHAGVAIKPVKATLQIGDLTKETQVKPGTKEVIFNVKLKAGKTRLSTRFIEANGKQFGAYYVYVRKK